MKYIYTTVITPNEDGTCFYAKVPDLDGCITTGKTLEDAIEQIQDAASVWLVVAEDNDDFISEPTPQSKIAHDDDSILSLISVDTIAYRAATDTKAVRKNVSLPSWMAVLADKRGINVSQLLQNALMEKLSLAK